MHPCNYPISLAIHVHDTEARIDSRLVGIRRRSIQIVQRESAEYVVLRSKLIVQTDRELIGIGGHLRGGRVGVRAKRALGKVRQRIPIQDLCDWRVDRHGKRIVGVGRCINPIPLLLGRHRKDLRRPEHLAKALVLDEIERFFSAIVNVGNNDRTAIGEPELIPFEGRKAPWICGG